MKGNRNIKGFRFNATKLKCIKTHHLRNQEEGKLKRVFVNLLDNAIKFTPPGGRIEISVEKEADLASVRVADTGPGMSQEQLIHIFDRFYRGSKNSSLAGSGLGLNIARAIVEAHRGKIEVESELGQGSIFTVHLPLSPP
ncbi:MAG: sensor histidine kinase, partial [Candidatus Jordarchaeaceae archaeon]